MGQQGLLRHVREFEPAAGLDCMAADEVPGERQDIVAALAQGSKRYWNYCEAKKKIFAKAPSSYLVLQYPIGCRNYPHFGLNRLGAAHSQELSSWSTRNNLTWNSLLISPISSRNRV